MARISYGVLPRRLEILPGPLPQLFTVIYPTLEVLDVLEGCFAFDAVILQGDFTAHGNLRQSNGHQGTEHSAQNQFHH